MVDPNFYRAFEDRFRGSREEVKSRLSVYLPFIAPFKTLGNLPQALDLGCGRGEWLELLQNQGFQGIGVDANNAMLTGCRELKLNTVHSDFLEWLKSVGSDSQSIVSAFHFVEHIPFEMFFELVKEAHRVLKPGGLLILETQNSENLLVGASTFYIDPTHQRPIHPLQLSFIAEYLGFERIKTLYLQEPLELATMQQVRLLHVLTGVSPDYAVVAQKKATKEITSLFDSCFEQSYGLRLGELADQFDQQTDNHKQWLQNLDTRNRALHTDNLRLQSELHAATTRVADLEQRAIAAETLIINILNSTSWQLTAPLRKIRSLVKNIFRSLGKSTSKTNARKG